MKLRNIAIVFVSAVLGKLSVLSILANHLDSAPEPRIPPAGEEIDRSQYFDSVVQQDLILLTSSVLVLVAIFAIAGYLTQNGQTYHNPEEIARNGGMIFVTILVALIIFPVYTLIFVITSPERAFDPSWFDAALLADTYTIGANPENPASPWVYLTNIAQALRYTIMGTITIILVHMISTTNVVTKGSAELYAQPQTG